MEELSQGREESLAEVGLKGSQRGLLREKPGASVGMKVGIGPREKGEQGVGKKTKATVK